MQRAGAPVSTSEISLLLEKAMRRLDAAGIESSWLDAQLLLAEAAHVDRTLLLTRNIALSPEVRSEFDAMVERRAAHEPVAYILGRREFYSLEFEVNRHVLIPRPETETAVDAVLRFIAGHPGAAVLDIGTGPGTIAVAVAANAHDAGIVATDISEAALALARRNAARNGVQERIKFLLGNLFEPLGGSPALGRFDVVVSNPPYIAAAQILSLAPEVRDFEPRDALDGGPDGLDFFRRITASVGSHLKPDGLLVLEVGDGQDDAVRKIAENAGLRQVEVISDLGGIVRVLTARP
jgi:release factor glutamine methyltransferase